MEFGVQRNHSARASVRIVHVLVRAAEAIAYNGLVQSWPEITSLASESGKPKSEQGGLSGETEE